MIVDPDFMDHWRTGMVADAIGDPMAAIYILRLWAHCQDRKSDTFVMPTAGLKAQCKCPAPAEVFETALVEAGFLSRDGDTITVLGWAEKNASLLAAWENGSKGGRPKKNPAETHGKPTGSPAVAHGQPIANPDETDKRREEKRGTPSLRSGGGAASRADSPRCPDGVPPQVWEDFLKLRKAKKAPVTETVIADAISEARKAGMPLEDFLSIWCARGSQGLRASWLTTEEHAKATKPQANTADRNATARRMLFGGPPPAQESFDA